MSNYWLDLEEQGNKQTAEYAEKFKQLDEKQTTRLYADIAEEQSRRLRFTLRDRSENLIISSEDDLSNYCNQLLRQHSRCTRTWEYLSTLRLIKEFIASEHPNNSEEVNFFTGNFKLPYWKCPQCNRRKCSTRPGVGGQGVFCENSGYNPASIHPDCTNCHCETMPDGNGIWEGRD